MRNSYAYLTLAALTLGGLVACGDDDSNTNTQPNTKPATKTEATGASICSTYYNLCPKPADGDTTTFKCDDASVDAMANKAAIATCMSEVTACANAQACFYAK